MPTAIKCVCIHCSGKIEFPDEMLGKQVNCPHCGMETLLYVPSAQSTAPSKTFSHKATSGGTKIYPAIIGSVFALMIFAGLGQWLESGNFFPGFFFGLLLGLLGSAILGFSICVYFLPSIIAYQSKKKNANAILILNLFFGWTLVGWVIALVWANLRAPIAE